MGLCSSCCRRRKSPESEPLLARPSQTDDLPPPRSKVEKVADVLAAINAGKLPSQEQIDRALRAVLASEVLDLTAGTRSYGPLSANGRKVLQDAREVINALLVVGLEKNYDNKLQDLLYHVQQIDTNSVSADVVVNVKDDSALPALESTVHELPTTEEVTADTLTLLRSLRHLTRLVLTSSAFRLILSDTLHTLREVLAAAAADVGSAALKAGMVAGQLENVVRPEGVRVDVLDEVVDRFQADVEGMEKLVSEREESVGREAPERVREVVVARLQQTMIQVHSNPQYHDAFQTILTLLTKYAIKVNSVSQSLSTTASRPAEAPVTLTPIVWADSHVSSALADLRVLLERLASGYSPDHALHLLNQTLTRLGSSADEKLKSFFTSVGAWFASALEGAGYAVSRGGTQALEELYDTARALLAEEANEAWAKDLRALVDETYKLVEALANDRGTQRLLGALDALSKDVGQLTSDALAKWQADLLGWLLPRLVKALLGVVPTPRVEYKNKTLDVVLDAGRLELGVGKDAVPDRVVVQNWSEVRLEAGAEGEGEVASAVGLGGGVQSFTRFRVHLDGVRLYARNIGYHLRYKGIVGYEDQGVVSVDVGSGAEQGLSVTVELEMEAGSWVEQKEGETLFRVVSVEVEIPGLKFVLDKSRHWVLNKVIVQPLAGPVVRSVLTGVLEGKIKEGLEAVAGWLGRIVGRAQGKAGVEEYWAGVLELAGVLPVEDEDEDEDEDEERSDTAETEPLVEETHTESTMTGVVRTTVTQKDAGSTPEESILAIGVGPQVLDDVAGPYGEAGEGAERSVLDEVSEGVDGAIRVGGEAAEAVGKTGEEVERARLRREVRRSVEGRVRGWRSRAFDL